MTTAAIATSTSEINLAALDDGSGHIAEDTLLSGLLGDTEVIDDDMAALGALLDDAILADDTTLVTGEEVGAGNVQAGGNEPIPDDDVAHGGTGQIDELAALGDALEAANAHVEEHGLPTSNAEEAGEEKKEAGEAAEGEEKKKRLGYGAKTSAKIAHKLGDKQSEFLILELSDAELDEEELAKKQAEVLAMCDGANQIKVREKMVQLFGWMRAGGKLNEVMKRAFEVLAKDGQLTTGDKGNLHANLLTKPYSPGTARAQSGQIFSLFPILKIVTKGDKGVWTVNPNSAIFAKAKAELGL